VDIYCQKCDEPWEVCYLGGGDFDEDCEKEDWENGKKPSERFKNGDGCPSCRWGKNAPKKQSLRGEAMGLMADLLGDDIDGMASMMDDFEFMGMLDE